MRRRRSGRIDIFQTFAILLVVSLFDSKGERK